MNEKDVNIKINNTTVYQIYNSEEKKSEEKYWWKILKKVLTYFMNKKFKSISRYTNNVKINRLYNFQTT